MTVSYIKTMVPGTCCLHYLQRGKAVTRLAYVSAVYEAGEYKQVRGQAEPVLTTSEEMILIADLLAITPYRAEVEAPDNQDVLIESPECPSECWIG